jgi:hypothetical protein
LELRHNEPLLKSSFQSPRELYIDLEEDLNSEPTYEPKDPVRDLKACINAMTTKEKGQLANEMGVGEDFPMA